MFLMTLEEEIQGLREENRVLGLRITELEGLLKEALDKLNKNSGNSSKPPSSDGFRKVQSLRTSSGKRPGGQRGHKGTTLQMQEVPDSIVLHEPLVCSHCHATLSDSASERVEKRQVYDLPVLHLCCTEHRRVQKTCPHCGTLNQGTFPKGVEQPVGYGERLKALCVYLTNYQLLPYGRCAQLLKDLLGHRPCQASLAALTQRCAKELRPFEQEVKEALLHSALLYCDETSLRCCSQTHWLHVAATENYTLYCVHPKRGAKALQDMGILEQYKGVTMHDYWQAYLEYACEHVFCHAHHLRDLTFCMEAENSHWAKEMKALLLQVKQSVEEERLKGEGALSVGQFAKYQQHYWQIMQRGASEHPQPQKQQDLPGRTAKSKSRNLWERFCEHADELLRFALDFTIPFSNNVAEQALRMMKVKQKIAGCFRSMQGAASFARIRSHVDTLRKQGRSILEDLKKAMEGTPWMPLKPAPA